MHLVQLLIPVFDPQGTRFPQSSYRNGGRQYRRDLEARFKQDEVVIRAHEFRRF